MRRAFSRLRPYLWRYRGGLALGMLCLGLKDLAHAVQPLMIRGAVDSLGAPGWHFLQYAMLLVAAAGIKGIFQYWMRVIIIGISRDIEYDLRNDLFRHLVNLAPDFFGRVRTGDIM